MNNYCHDCSFYKDIAGGYTVSSIVYGVGGHRLSRESSYRCLNNNLDDPKTPKWCPKKDKRSK